MADRGTDLAYSTLDSPYIFTEKDLIDRIINVKITTKPFSTSKIVTHKVEDVFVIRSDYEIEINEGKGYRIKKCEIKPSIKVQYKQVSSGTGIEIDLFLSNFFIMTKDGRTLMSINQSTYDIAKIEIQMGYLGQFNKLLGISSGTSVASLTYEDLFDFDRQGAGIQTIVISDVEKVTTDKLPPDYTLHIHGYVGNTTNTSEIPKAELVYSDVPSSAYITVKDKPLPALFYKYITRRFLNVNVFPKGTTFPSLESDGFFSEANANTYGVKVVCSKKVQELKLNEIKDKSGNTVDVSAFMFLGGNANTVDSSMQKIIEYTKKDITYVRLNSGVILVVAREELEQTNLPDLFEDIKDYVDANTQLHLNFHNTLPCVYNINIDALATIVCPFFTWLNPFQYFYFKTRYALSNTVSFYANYNPSVYKFYAINCLISFATVEDVNEMNIIAVSDRSES